MRFVLPVFVPYSEFFYKISQSRQMVTVSVLESGSGESAQRIAFILSFLLDKERTVKDFRFPKLQCTAVLSYQITRNNLLVEQVPLILVTERTDALLKELPGSMHGSDPDYISRSQQPVRRPVGRRAPFGKIFEKEPRQVYG